jgi:hypothetical protein
MLRFVAHQYGTKAGFDFQMHMMLIFTDFHQPRYVPYDVRSLGGGSGIFLILFA